MREGDTQTDRHTDRQTERQTDRQTGRQTGRQADRQTGIMSVHTPTVSALRVTAAYRGIFCHDQKSCCLNMTFVFSLSFILRIHH